MMRKSGRAGMRRQVGLYQDEIDHDEITKNDSRTAENAFAIAQQEISCP